MHVDPRRVALVMALLVVGTVPQATRAVVSEADVAEGVRFRSEMGFVTDLDFINAVSRDIRSSWDYGVALTPTEKAEIDRRLEIGAQSGPLSRHLRSVPTYAGGYTDWQRTRTAAGEAAQEPQKAKAEPARASRRPAKLSWKEARELEELPARLEALEQEQKTLAERLADPALYQDRSIDVRALNARHDAIDAELTRLLARWEELEAKK